VGTRPAAEERKEGERERGRGRRRERLNREKRREESAIPFVLFLWRPRDRLVIYTSGRGQISAKDLGVTCCQRFSVFFTCSPRSSFLLLSRRSVAISLLPLCRFLFFLSAVFSSSSFFLFSRFPRLAFYPFKSYHAEGYINLFGWRVPAFGVCLSRIILRIRFLSSIEPDGMLYYASLTSMR